MAAEKEISCGEGHQKIIKDRLTRHFVLIFPVWIELALSKNRGCFSKLSLANFFGVQFNNSASCGKTKHCFICYLPTIPLEKSAEKVLASLQRQTKVTGKLEQVV